MKDGVIVEAGETIEVFENPKHEYTKELIEAIPAKAEIDFMRSSHSREP
jgi:peptide/nickel transport system ATP-binding protein